MLERFIVFDVETPNYNNDRMSAIGITVVENGRIVEDFGTLVDPEARFDRFNVELTGITPAMVVGKPNFSGLWEQIEPIMDSGVLVAHNAPFDMRVLASCLRAYGIVWKPSAPYACTCSMGRKCYPDLPNHKLNTMCSHLQIGLNHHDAASDSHACAELLVDYLHRGFDVRPFIRTYCF